MEGYLSLIICVLGLVIYFITGNPTTPPPSTVNQKCNVIGLHMFWVGLLVFLLQLGPTMTGILNHR